MSVGWLRDLEEKVHEASERLRAREAENRELRRRVEELAAELASRQEGTPEAVTWAEEREDVRRRVEELARHLEELLGAEAADADDADGDDGG